MEKLCHLTPKNVGQFFYIRFDVKKMRGSWTYNSELGYKHCHLLPQFSWQLIDQQKHISLSHFSWWKIHCFCSDFLRRRANGNNRKKSTSFLPGWTHFHCYFRRLCDQSKSRLLFNQNRLHFFRTVEQSQQKPRHALHFNNLFACTKFISPILWLQLGFGKCINFQPSSRKRE